MADRRALTRTDRVAYGCLLAAFVVPLLVASQYGRAALLTAVVPAAVYAVLSAAGLWWVGRRLADRWSIVFGLSWGAAGAALVGLQLVQLVYASGTWNLVRAVVFAPAVEESLKLLAVVVTAALLSARERRRSGRLSFLLAAAASGIGFAFTENLVYFAMWYHASPALGQDPVGTMLHFGLSRGPVALLGHPLFAALGAAVVATGLGRRTPERVGLVVAGFAVAVGTHAGWNLIAETTSDPLPVTAYGVLLLAVATPVVLRLRGVTIPQVRPAEPRVRPAEPRPPVRPVQPLPESAGRWRDLDTVPRPGEAAAPPGYQSAKPGDVRDHNDSAPRRAPDEGIAAGREGRFEEPGEERVGAGVETVEEHIRVLLQHDHAAEALRLLDRLLGVRRSPAEVAKLRVLRLATVVAASPGAEQGAQDAVTAAWSALADHPDPRLLGRYHTLVGSLRYGAGSIEESLDHFRDAEWALQGAQPAYGMVEAWYELAAAYSRADLHTLAFSAYRTARRLATGGDTYSPGALVPVRLALSRDHRGDTEGCQRILRTVVSDFVHRRREGGLRTVPPYELAVYGYAAARLAALGEAVTVDPAPLLEAGGNQELVRTIRQAGTACLSIAARKHTEALLLISRIPHREDPLAAAELPRLRSIAYAGLGAFEAAYAAEREVIRAVARTLMRTREGLVRAAVARKEPATRSRGVDAALLNRLTGLPDRRYLEQHLRQLPGGADVVLGIIDIHGVRHNPASGLLLRRLAAILSQVLRQGDLIARYGESQFVVVLHDIGLGAAERIGRRMLRTVADQEWESLVPESRVGIDVSWAALDPSLGGLAAATAALKSLGAAQRARIT